jgi:hypothetical protein
MEIEKVIEHKKTGAWFSEAKIYLKVSYTSLRRPLRQYRLSSNSRMQHLYWVEVI